MTRGIRKVRRSIRQRKKRQKQSPQIKKNQDIYPFFQEEEKHGFHPSVYEYTNKDKQSNIVHLPSITAKIFICITLFACTAFILSNENERLIPAKSWLSSQLQDDFPFAKAKSWYEDVLGGTPLSIAPQGNIQNIESNELLLPVTGQVVETFSTNGTGITISPSHKTAVTSIDNGIVIFAGKDKKTKKTITIQHADGSNTTYGNLSAVDVHAYQQVQANQRIGTFSPTKDNKTVFFSVEKDNHYIDPAQVIPVDNLP